MDPSLKREDRKPKVRISRPKQADYDAMIAKRRSELRAICEQLESGALEPSDWADAFDAILLEGHTQGYMLGRQRAGDLTPLNETDRLIAVAAKDGEAQYLAGFVDALTDPESGLLDEDGNIVPGKVLNRANLYLGKIRATASQGFVDAGDGGEEYEWILVAEKHCTDCPMIAALSPFTKQTLFQYPGDGNTECLGNCKCYLRRLGDGRTCFESAS